MSVEIRVPPLGESVVEATVSRWLKQEGDAVAAGDILVELETDKVNVEVPSEESGRLTAISHHEGEVVAINDVLATLEPGPAATNGSAPAAKPTSSIQTEMPAAIKGETPVSANSDNGRTPATPVAQRLATENGIDISLVHGTGPGGKVVKEDVESFLSRGEDHPTPAPSVNAVVAPQTTTPPRTQAPVMANPLTALFTTAPDRREERKPMSPLRQTVARRLVEAQHTSAMLTTFNEVDMSAIMEVRKRRKEAFTKLHGVGLGFMSFFTKAIVGALKAFPLLNAEIQGNEILLKKYYDISVAVSTERGLVVPVLRDADRKTFAEIEKGIGDLATRARENKLTLPELMGGTFTITNGGVFGSLLSTPILNSPQVGILGMHKIEERAVVINGEIVIRPMMYVALSYDHRIVDGSEAVRFLVMVKSMLEDPETMLLEG